MANVGTDAKHEINFCWPNFAFTASYIKLIIIISLSRLKYKINKENKCKQLAAMFRHCNCPMSLSGKVNFTVTEHII